ncbi:MAG: hypothetical protein IKZ87_02285 [Actinomycetaceae bacterium]|nr:hypothetical protein [Actinomycetaceae bacterium]
MAHIRQTPAGRWCAEIQRRGVREARNFATKTEAKLWATKRETEILANAAAGNEALPRRTLREAMERYLREVSAGRRTERADRQRLTFFAREFPALADKALLDITVKRMKTPRPSASVGRTESQLVLCSFVPCRAPPLRYRCT